MQRGLKELQVVKVRHLAELQDLSNPGVSGEDGSLTGITEANDRQPVLPDR